MSQQEFFQQPEQRKRRDQEAESASTYYRKSGNVPKEEHPSTFEDSVPPYVYRAQDTRNSSEQEQQARPPFSDNSAGHSSQRFSTWYQRPYRARRGAAQRPGYWQNMLVRWAMIILLIFVLLHILPFLISVLLVIAGVLAVALLLPIFIIFGMVAAVAIIALIALRMLGIPVPWGWLRARLFRR